MTKVSVVLKRMTSQAVQDVVLIGYFSGEWVQGHCHKTLLNFCFDFLEDLWASLEHASSKPVGAVMETWTKQMGFPVLSVSAEQVMNVWL